MQGKEWELITKKSQKFLDLESRKYGNKMLVHNQEYLGKVGIGTIVYPGERRVADIAGLKIGEKYDGWGNTCAVVIPISNKETQEKIRKYLGKSVNFWK